MNQPPGYPPGGPPQYPGQPGFPPQGQAPQAQPQAPQGNFGGTMLMPSSPQAAAMQAAQAQAQAQAAQAAQQGAYGQPPPGMPGAPPAYGAPPGQPAYGQPPPGQPGFGQPPPAYGAPPPGAPYGAPPGAPAPYGAPPGGPAPYGAPPGYPGAAPGAPPGYGQQPGAAPQAQAGAIQGPSFGIGGIGRGGMPTIKFSGGDLHPSKAFSVVVKGDGYASPRKVGLMMLGLAIVFFVVNGVMVVALNRWYPYFVCVGTFMFWPALWLIITGQPRARDDGSPVPMWSRAGLAAFWALGLLSALAYGLLFGMIMAAVGATN